MKTDIRAMSNKDLDDMNERARKWKEFCKEFIEFEEHFKAKYGEIIYPEDCES